MRRSSWECKASWLLEHIMFSQTPATAFVASAACHCCSQLLDAHVLTAKALMLKAAAHRCSSCRSLMSSNSI